MDTKTWYLGSLAHEQRFLNNVKMKKINNFKKFIQISIIQHSILYKIPFVLTETELVLTSMLVHVFRQLKATYNIN